MMATEQRYTRIEEIERANDRAGYHYFEPATMRFFDSRVLSGVYDGRFFITSERFKMYEPRYRVDPRMYTIREAFPDGQIDTVGAFQAFGSAATAKRWAQRVIDARLLRVNRDARPPVACSEDDCTHLATHITRTNATPCGDHLFDVIKREAKL